MKNSISLTIPEPCSESWDSFRKTNTGGFCSSCKKEVIDFTNWSEEEIKTFFRKSSSSTCGRFHINQLKTYTFHERLVKRQNAWLPLSFLGCSLLFSGHATAQTVQPTETSVKHGEVSAPDLNDTASGSKTISGIVKAKEDDAPMPGVTIRRKGHAEETTTDANGKFSLTISEPQPNDTLVLGFIGYKTLAYSLPAEQNVEVTLRLEMETEALEPISGVAGGIVVGGARAYNPWSPRGIWWKMKNIFRR